MHGDTYTPESTSRSQSPTPSRSRSPSPNKLVKNGYVNGSTNGDSKTPTQSPQHSQGGVSLQNNHTQQSFFGHEREQVARILIQGLQDLGYGGAAQALTDESGYELESTSAAAFRDAILSGNWAEAESFLLGESKRRRSTNGVQQNGKAVTNGHVEKSKRRTLRLRDDADRDEMLFLIRQQKYLELLEQGDAPAALMCLRQELHELHQDQQQLHSLSSLIMCRSPEEVKQQASWDGAQGTSRQKLLSNLSGAISPSIMLKDHRLARLLDQWKDSQIDNCLYHNTFDIPSLYLDHSCTRDDFPLDPVVELDHHTQEVWFVEFSNDGKYVATAGQDKTVAIYDTMEFRLRHMLSDHREGVAALAWSPDDKNLVSCSQDKEARLWDVATGRCLRVLKHHDSPITCAAWAPDGQSFVLGSVDFNRPLSIWPLRSASNDPNPIYTFERNGLNRVQDCAIAAVTPSTSYESDVSRSTTSSRQPVRLAALSIDRIIHVYDYVTREKLHQIDVGHTLTSIQMSRDGQEMIVNLSCNEVWSLGVEDGNVRRKYQGQQQGNYIIRGCYGGASEGVVVSGGEDGRICIWHRHSARLLEQLDGHNPASVNTVAWNRANPKMFASAGDDCKVRIWAALNSDLGQSAMAQSMRRRSRSNGQMSVSDEPRAPQWGSSTAGGAISGLSALLRR